MAKSISVNQKKKRSRGRPATGRDPVHAVRLPKEIRAGLEQWIKEQPKPQPTLSEAIRYALRDWLINIGLMKPQK